MRVLSSCGTKQSSTSSSVSTAAEHSGSGEEGTAAGAWHSKLKLPVASMLSQQGELMLKIGMVLCFASVMFMAWFMDHFYGGGATQSWAEAMGLAALRLPDLSLELVLEFGVTLRWPSELQAPQIGFIFWKRRYESVADAQALVQVCGWPSESAP